MISIAFGNEGGRLALPRLSVFSVLMKASLSVFIPPGS